MEPAGTAAYREHTPAVLRWELMDAATRRTLSAALRQRYPWVVDPEWGPSAVEAGDCDSCALEPRLVTTCGPGDAICLGRRCAQAVGIDGWCAGHSREATQLLAHLANLPPEADAVARLWWVATGEVVLDPALEERLRERVRLEPRHGSKDVRT